MIVEQLEWEDAWEEPNEEGEDIIGGY